MSIKQFIKVPVTTQMVKEYDECVQMMNSGNEKDCEECSLNGGSVGCLGEVNWLIDRRSIFKEIKSCIKIVVKSVVAQICF